MRVERFPDPGTKVPASEFLITSGGQAGNAAVAIARLSGQVDFAGPMGAQDDEFANRIINILLSENIDCKGAVRVPGATTSVSLILVDAEGEKMIATRRAASGSSQSRYLSMALSSASQPRQPIVYQINEATPIGNNAMPAQTTSSDGK